MESKELPTAIQLSISKEIGKRQDLTKKQLSDSAIRILLSDKYSKVNGLECAESIKNPIKGHWRDKKRQKEACAKLYIKHLKGLR